MLLKHLSPPFFQKCVGFQHVNTSFKKKIKIQQRTKTKYLNTLGGVEVG